MRSSTTHANKKNRASGAACLHITALVNFTP